MLFEMEVRENAGRLPTDGFVSLLQKEYVI